ncbi:MAG: transposase [Kiritimatiellia bacterium]
MTEIPAQDAPPPYRLDAAHPHLSHAPPPHDYFNPDESVDIHKNDLPHWQQGGAWIFVTFRMGDAMPAEKLKQWNRERNEWMTLHPDPWDEQTLWEYHRTFTERLEHWLDSGEGSCALRDPAVRQVVEKALLHFEGERYDLDDFVIMPNHAHVLFRPVNGHVLPKILHSWKSYTGGVINKMIGQSGGFWQEDYWDRLVRSENHMNHCRRYIAENPVKAHLGEVEYTWRSKR